jgi:hypothetical protein
MNDFTDREIPAIEKIRSVTAGKHQPQKAQISFVNFVLFVEINSRANLERFFL